MIVTCPSCSTRYELGEAALARGRNVRCKQCKHIWHEAPQPVADDKIVPESMLVPALDRDFGEKQPQSGPSIETSAFAAQLRPADAESMAEAKYQVEQEQDPILPARSPALVSEKLKTAVRFSLTTAGWSSVAVLGILFFAIIIAGKDRIAGRWPFTVSLYNSLGFSAGPRSAGLQIQHASMEFKDQDGKSVLVVKGQIFNATNAAHRLVPIHIKLRDAQEKTLTSWSVKPRVSSVPPNGSMPFETQLPGSREIVSSEILIGP